jgi:uncharacterized protein YegP (UPF0339 family)
MSEHKVIVYRDKSGEWRWRRTAANGELVATSGEGYVNKKHCVDIASRVNVGTDITVEEAP